MSKFKKATFGNGCFWCTEAVFKKLRGVEDIISGYAGGDTEDPTYEEVSSGDTGHAEVIQITYNPKVISYNNLLYVFWRTHDPTTPNQQGNDIGSQYRSIIFYHDEKQKNLAENSREKIAASGLYPNPIVTEIEPLHKFYPAENYHRDYYARNRNQPYCRFVIDPKIKKLEKEFKGLIG